MTPRLSLRVRVASATALAIAIAVVLLGAATLSLVNHELHRSLDNALKARAAEVARLAATTPRLITAAGVLEGRVGTSAAYVQVVDSKGRIVARSAALGGRVLPDTLVLDRALADRTAGYGNADLGTEPLRVYAAPLSSIGGGPAAGGAVAIAGSTSGIADTIDPLRGLVLLAAVAAALIAGLASVLLTRRALRPLTRLTSGAEAIERTGDPARRLPATVAPDSPAARDEVGRLAATLNAMLASLERASERERRFVDDASHELRTPLTALRGNAAFVARHGADPAALADIEADAERLAGLLDDLLALAREDAASAPLDPQAEPIALAELAEEVAGDAADARVHVEVALGAAERARVRGDRAALARAVRNLVENALRHGKGAVTIGVSADARHAFVSVTDEGPGLTPAEAERAFVRFWRGERAAPGGSGLGLAIVRATAERHDGRVTVDGARFTIELPRAPALRELSNSAGRTSRQSNAKGRR